MPFCHICLEYAYQPCDNSRVFIAGCPRLAPPAPRPFRSWLSRLLNRLFRRI